MSGTERFSGAGAEEVSGAQDAPHDHDLRSRSAGLERGRVRIIAGGVVALTSAWTVFLAWLVGSLLGLW